MRSSRRCSRACGDHGALAVELEHEGHGPVVLGLLQLVGHEVDEHAVEEAADLDHGHVARRRRPDAGRPRRAGRAARTAPAGVRARRWPWIASAPSARRSSRPGRPRPGRQSLDPARFFGASRLVIVAGKGGVGKTVVSATMARAAARVGPVDAGDRGRGQVGPVLDVRAGRRSTTRRRPCPAAGGPRGEGEVRARTLTPDEALLDYLRDHGLSRISRRLVSSGALDVVATAAPGIKDILILGQGQAARAAGRDRPRHPRRAGRGARHHLPAVGPRAARHRARRPDQRAGTGRARDAHGPRAMPRRARDAARGDPGQRAGRHRLQPRGPRGRRPRARGRERPLRRAGGRGRGSRDRGGRGGATSRCATARPTRWRGPRPSGPTAPRCRPSSWPGWPSASRCRSCGSRSCSPPRSAPTSSSCSPTACSRRSTRSRRPCDHGSEPARARRAAPHPRVLRVGRRRQDDHRGRARPRGGQGGAPRGGGHDRPGQAPGRRARPRRAHRHAVGRSRGTGPASCGR